MWHSSVNHKGGARSPYVWTKVIKLLELVHIQPDSQLSFISPRYSEHHGRRPQQTFLLNHEWELNSRVLHKIFLAWRFQEVDLFATATNTKCIRYCCRRGLEPQSQGDTFLISWTNGFLYVYPLTPLLLEVLNKIRPKSYWLHQCGDEKFGLSSNQTHLSPSMAASVHSLPTDSWCRSNSSPHPNKRTGTHTHTHTIYGIHQREGCAMGPSKIFTLGVLRMN